MIQRNVTLKDRKIKLLSQVLGNFSRKGKSVCIDCCEEEIAILKCHQKTSPWLVGAK